MYRINPKFSGCMKRREDNNYDKTGHYHLVRLIPRNSTGKNTKEFSAAEEGWPASYPEVGFALAGLVVSEVANYSGGKKSRDVRNIVNQKIAFLHELIDIAANLGIKMSGRAGTVTDDLLWAVVKLAAQRNSDHIADSDNNAWNLYIGDKDLPDVSDCIE